MGSRGLTGFAGFLLGSVARSVAKHARCSVLVARGSHERVSSVVLAVDDSRHAADALRASVLLPLPTEAEIAVTHVVRPYVPYAALGSEFVMGLEGMIESVRDTQRADARRLVDQACAQLAKAGKHPVGVIREGDPATEILTVAREREADLVVAGARGVSLIEGFVMGSVADRLLTDAATSLLIAR